MDVMQNNHSIIHRLPLPRPEANADLVGHAAAEHLLWQAWHGNRLAHAWLVSGARGIGKATLACRFSKFILACTNASRMCTPLYLPPSHPTFRRVAARSHADFRLIERGSDDSDQRRTQIVVEDIRDLSRFLTLTAAEGGWRVAVIDDAESMNDSAGNALLKILEEPTSQSLILLVSHSPGQLLPTIRSRCCSLPLCPLTERQVSVLLKRYRPALTPAAVLVLARLAEGSVGRALALADNNGVALYRTMLDLLASIPHLDGPALHAFSDQIAQADSRLFKTYGELLSAWLVRVARYGITGQMMAEVLPGEATLASHLTKVIRLDQWVEVWEKISHLYSRAEGLNLDRRQVVMSAFFAIAKLTRAR
ncbi:DNA polymerase III delta prime subunit [invertebrate metagenome]|uniref:DNA polymerase III delta prime subunit n=1 Tax=invertebrate metagenome TaxID=1711999 RepID=A0A484H497_9ZZZZ